MPSLVAPPHRAPAKTTASRPGARRLFFVSLPYLILAAGCAAYLYPFMRVFTGGGDEGSLINGAVRVTEGEVPYRDFFEVIGPGTFYWVAFFFKLFGATWIATRVSLMVALITNTVLLLFFLTRRLRTGVEAAPALFCLAISFPPWAEVSHHIVGNLFALLSFAILVSWLDTRRAGMLFIAGIMTGLTTCVMLPTGIFLLLSFLVILWALASNEPGFYKSIVGLMAGYLAVALSVVLLFWSAGALPGIVYANLIWPLSNYGGVNAVPYGFLIAKYWNAWATSLSPLISPAGATCAMPAFLPFRSWW